MKIAFTSCMSATAYPNQPVWKTIQDQNPDILVLLGDSIYNDCPHISIGGDMVHPKDLTDNTFCDHMHDLYKQQLAVPQFKKLINTVPTYAIWDDHDFLWNDADASDSQNILNRGKAYYSSQLFQCWREALKIGGLSFPKTTNVTRIQKNYANLINEDYNLYMPGYQAIKFDKNTIDSLKVDIILHLTDGRSWRKDNSLLGTGQRKAIEASMLNNPTAVHLIASGSTFGSSGKQGWAGYSFDHNWLMNLSNNYNILILSGDIHKNTFNYFANPNQTKNIFDATSSGAAIDFIRIHNSGQSSTTDKFNYSEHFGLLEFNTKGIQIKFFDHGNYSSLGLTTIDKNFKSSKVEKI